MLQRSTQPKWATPLWLLCVLMPLMPATAQNFALDFTNNRLEIPYIGTGVDFSEITVEAYVFWRGHTGTEGVSGILEGRAGVVHWQINANNNVRIRFEGVDQNASAGIQQNEWFHLAATYNRATLELKCYKNGVVYHTFSGNSNTNTYWTSGDAQFGTSNRSGDRRWNGLLDELRIWNKARTAEQILEGLTNELFGTEEGLIAYWKLNEGQGTTAFDSGPNGHHGTIVGATWSPNAAPVTPLGFAYSPVPASGATDIPRDSILSWTPGGDAEKHTVYFGVDQAGVEAADATNPMGVLVSQDQAATTYSPAALEYGQTYFWRVDEPGFKGRVWSFTVEPYAYPIQNVTATASSAQADMEPENAVNGSGLDAQDQHGVEGTQMWLSSGVQPNWIQFEFEQAYKLHELWVWNSNQLIEAFIGFGAKDVKIEHSLDGENWTELAGVPEFAKADAAPTYTANTTVDFGGAVAQYVKLTINSSWGGLPTTGLAEVRFFAVPVQAREPVPADATTGVALDATLNWRPGREAASHQVYFGTDPNAVADGTAATQTVADYTFSPATMDYARTYYWRVDEVNDAMTPATHEGAVWSFTTQEFGVVEDFESYNDDDNRIYESWVDGVTDGKSGSTVGYFDAPFAERTIIHGGKQSMPLQYDNATMAFSEATFTFATAQNWTASDIKSLSLYFQGAPDNTGNLYLKINNTKVAYSGDAADIAKSAWLPWNIDLSTVGGSLSNVTKLVIGIEGSGAKGLVYIDDIRLYPKTPEFITPADPGTAGLLALYAFEGNANDSSANKLNGTIKDGQLVASGRPNGGSALSVSKAGYADLGNPPLLDFSTGDWSVAAWYKTAMTGNSDPEKGTIFAKGGDTAGGHRYALIMSETTSGVVTLVTDDDVTKYVVNSTSVTNNDEWHFVVGQREGTALRIYIDGVLEGTATATATYSLAGTKQHNAYIGASTDHTNNVLYKLYNGLIDDVRVFNRALSEAEILWLAGRTTSVAKPF